MPCPPYETNLTKGLIPVLWRDPAGRGARVSKGRENGVVYCAPLPLLSNRYHESGSSSARECFEPRLKYFQRKGKKTQTNLSWRLFQSLLTSAYIAQNATNYRPFYYQPWVYDACWCCTFTALAAGIRLAFPCSWCLREDPLGSGWSLQPSLNWVNKNGFCFALPMKGCHASRLEVHRSFGQTRLIQEPRLVGWLFWSQSV